MKNFNLPGFRDFYPEDLEKLNYIFNQWNRLCKSYGFEEWDCPILESVDIYKIKSGEEIVDQLFNFRDRGDREIALRPEMTPSLVRMIINKKRNISFPVKWFSVSRCFRTERQQKGRLKEFFQLNVDIVGEPEGWPDAEVLSLARDILLSFGLTKNDFTIKINHRELVNAFFSSLNLDDNQKSKIYLVVDKSTKQPFEATEEQLASLGLNKDVQSKLISYLMIKSFNQAKSFFSDIGIKEFELLENLFKWFEYYKLLDYTDFDPSIVRGLAYYTGSVYEIFPTSSESPNRALLGGGRYDNLFNAFNSESFPACGFGIGDVVLDLLLNEKKLFNANKYRFDYFIVSIGDVKKEFIINLVSELRKKNKSVNFSFSQKNVSKQFKQANKLNSRYTIIIGEDEVLNGNIKIKDMETGDEITENVMDYIEGL